MKTFNLILAFLFMTVLTSCDDGKSLQKYYVENQEDTDFLALDVPTSMFANIESMDEEQKTTMQTIKKINVLALRADQHPAKFEMEKSKLSEIFQDEKYQLLMKYGGGDRKAELYFTGEDDAIDEIIVYGYDDEKGLGIARVLGEDMNPEKIMQLMRSLDKDDINVDGLEGLGSILGSVHYDEKDSVKVKIETKIDSEGKLKEIDSAAKE